MAVGPSSLRNRERRELMAHAASLIYGKQWRVPLAAAFHLHLSTVMRWNAGGHNIPADAIVRLRSLLKMRRAQLDWMIDKLDRHLST